jgi:hypothetical protein
MLDWERIAWTIGQAANVRGATVGKFQADRQRLGNAPGVIREDEAYTVDEFCARTGLGRNSVSHAELDGLRTIFVGRRKYVRGAAWLAFLKEREISRKELKELPNDHEEDDDS